MATYKASCVGRGLPACGILKCLAAPDWIKDPISGLSWSGTTLRRPVNVGDTQKDAAAAEKAGIPFIFAEYGFGDAPNAALRIGSIEELPQAVAAAFSQN